MANDTPKLIRWFEEQFFDNESIQKDLQSELSSFFGDDKDKIIDNAIKQGEKKWQGSQDALEKMRDVWENVLKSKKGSDIDSIISENKSKGIVELDKITNLSSEGNMRVLNRVSELIDKEEVGKLAKIGDISFNIQERVNQELRERGSQIKRQDIIDSGLSNLGIRKFSDRLGLSQENATELLIREGFTVKNKRIKK